MPSGGGNRGRFNPLNISNSRQTPNLKKEGAATNCLSSLAATLFSFFSFVRWISTVAAFLSAEATTPAGRLE
ncbi:unnamed protein product [Linum tenue]|uniref:Uncharacterized protein n=1 Tax=Linum tenue TaxID=586396 RepID=A0AAV0MT57_9ROSI|nr:unnamed protein product [Linum tenue]CAI0452066.1 unnamed protein product [Linum tenue]